MYIDVVLVDTGKGKVKLYEAPAWSHLQAGDEVGTDKLLNRDGVVRAVCTVDTFSEEYGFLIKGFKSIDPLPRLKGRYEFRPFFYPEEREED